MLKANGNKKDDKLQKHVKNDANSVAGNNTQVYSTSVNQVRNSTKQLKHRDKSPELTKALNKITQLEKKVNDLNNKLLMALADYQNLVKNVEHQRQQLISIVKRDVFSDLIDLFTDLYVSVDALDDKAKDNPYIKGVLQIIEKYKNLLKKHGVDEISFNEGDAIDPNYMQVIAYELSNEYDNKVFKVVEPGYKIGDYVLRPARIIAFKLVKQDKK